MSPRVSGAALALIAAVLLALSGATSAWYRGHPTVGGHTREAQTFFVGLHGAERCDTGGDGECHDVSPQGAFTGIGYAELGLACVAAALAAAMALSTWRASERRKGLAVAVRYAVGASAVGAVLLLVIGPTDQGSIPIGYGVVMFWAGAIVAAIASAIAVRPPAPIRLVTGAAESGFPTVPLDALASLPAAQQADAASILYDAPPAPAPMYAAAAAKRPPPVPVPMALRSAAAELRVADAQGYDEHASYVAPPAPVYESAFGAPAAPLAPGPALAGPLSFGAAPAAVGFVAPGPVLAGPPPMPPMSAAPSARPRLPSTPMPPSASPMSPMSMPPMPSSPASSMPARPLSVSAPPMSPVARPPAPPDRPRTLPPPLAPKTPPIPQAALPMRDPIASAAAPSATPVRAPLPSANPLPRPGPITRPAPLAMPAGGLKPLTLPPLPTPVAAAPVPAATPPRESEPTEALPLVGDSTSPNIVPFASSEEADVAADEALAPRDEPGDVAGGVFGDSLPASADADRIGSSTDVSPRAPDDVRASAELPVAPPPAPVEPTPPVPLSTAPDSLPPPKASVSSGPSPACPQCEAPMAWVEEHLRFYCKSCRMYF